MPLFKIRNKEIDLLKPIEFKTEKEIQNLIENNLNDVFNCTFLASEYSTGPEHGGRIDTLALSEENNPVIIEYKKIESSQLVNQSMYYLDWLKDHHGDFQILVSKMFVGNDVSVDWMDIRVICIAPSYSKYDINAVKNFGVNIELWQYHLYESNMLYLEKIFPISTTKLKVKSDRNEIMTFDIHLKNVNKDIKEIAIEMSEFIKDLDEGVAETPKKFYIAYKLAQNFVCMQVNQNMIYIYLKIEPSSLNILPSKGRDVTNIGHLGTGNLEIKIENKEDFENSKEFIIQSFKNVGG